MNATQRAFFEQKINKMGINLEELKKQKEKVDIKDKLR